jgi:hypothetical protein
VINLSIDFDGTVLWNGTVVRDLAIAQRSGMQRIGFAGQERFRD